MSPTATISTAPTSSTSTSSSSPATKIIPEKVDNDDDTNSNNLNVSDSDDTKPVNYICLFHILNCTSTFPNARDWKAHVLSHFHTYPPPSIARCPLCPDRYFTSPSQSPSPSPSPSDTKPTPLPKPTPNTTSKAWDLMLDHLAKEHYQNGQTLTGSRPDFELMHYLYRMRIISAEEFKVLQLSPAPSNPAYQGGQSEIVRRSVGSADEPFLRVYCRRREGREKRGR